MSLMRQNPALQPHKRLFLLCAWALFLCLTVCANSRTVLDLRTNYESHPRSIEKAPVFSWRMDAGGEMGAAQSAYRILVAKDYLALRNGFWIWDSGIQKDNGSVCKYYQGPSLKPMTEYCWQVLVWDENGKMIESEPAYFETALMEQGWGNAQWIGSPDDCISKYSVNLIFEYDLQIPQGSQRGSFVFGARNEKNYWTAELNVKGAPELIFSCIDEGKRTELKRISLANYIPEGEKHKSHHFCLSNRPEAYSHYELIVKVDGQKVKDENGNSVFSLQHEHWAELCRLHAIGYEQPQGEQAIFKNITLSDSEVNTLLQTDTATYQANGSGKLKSWNPGARIAAPYLRKSFALEKSVKSARWYTTARGIYELEINGKAVSEDFFNPGWTDYRCRLMYNIYDVTKLLQKGRNALGVVLGEGWWKGLRHMNPKWYHIYGAQLSFLGRLEITYEDGSKESIVTDKSWVCSNDGPVMTNGLYEGEDYDARREMPGWSTPDYRDADWKPCKIYEPLDQKVAIVPYVGQSVRPEMVRTAQAVSEPTPKTYIYDMGQNMVGVPRVTLKGQRGQKITIRYGEMTYPEVIPTDPVEPYTIDEYKSKRGQLYTENYRSAMSTDYYIMKGDAAGETFCPHLTCHGFRYLEITGLDAPIDKENVQVLVLNSLPEGNDCSFETSNALVNQLFSNIQWGERSNFLTIPTDCPQRDERAGWSGDAQIFCRTATYNKTVAPFFHRWMQTVRDEQLPDGGFTDTNPAPPGGSAFGWAEVGIVVPWQIYQQYGDKTMLEENYNAMKKYINCIEHKATNYIQPYGGYGDWVAVIGTQSDLTNTCFAAMDYQLMQQIAHVLGKTEDEQRFAQDLERTKEAFCKRYVSEDGHIVAPVGSPVSVTPYGGASQEKVTQPTPIKTQTAYVMPLQMGLLPESLAPKAAQYLADLVKDNGYRLNTGFIGTPYLNLVLSKYGFDDVSYRLIEQQEYPSWLYPVLQGATTMWERWNSYTLKNGFGPVSMNSFNHYAYGAVQDWLMAYAAGIQRDESAPAYKHILLQPRVGGTFTHIKASYNTMYGEVKSAWQRENSSSAAAWTYTVTIPANASATLVLPDSVKKIKVLQGKQGVSKNRTNKQKRAFELTSGTFQFLIQQ